MQQQIALQSARRDTLQLLAQQEADGTGGSKLKNLGPIYKAKKADADSAQAALEKLQQQQAADRAELAGIDAEVATTIAQLKRDQLNGFASRLDALGTLTQNSAPIRWANWFIILLFIAIETAPVFVKLISPRGPYDDLLEQHEYGFAMHKKERKAMLTLETDERIAVRTGESEHRVKNAAFS
jgi:multidrug efflux pump subunit AcrA (membrane-fusion protein)